MKNKVPCVQCGTGCYGDYCIKCFNKRLTSNPLRKGKTGYKQTEEHIRKIRRTWDNKTIEELTIIRKKVSLANSKENNGMWKGEEVGYGALHGWIKSHKQKPDLCEECNKEKSFDLANISGEYKRDINDFKWLCRSCHTKLDYKNGIRGALCP